MAETVASSASADKQEPRQEERQSVVIVFSGDSGDGMQLTGDQFTNTSAILGNDVSTFPDIPAEIRAPAGTIPGLSGYQVNFSSTELYTAGDSPQVLVAMNPAALKANLPDLDSGGTIIVNTDTFNRNGLRKAGYESNPLEGEGLSGYDVHQVPLTTLTRNALEDIEGMSNQEKDKCKNAFALGLVFWMFDRPIDFTMKFYETKFASRPEVVESNSRVLKAGYYYGETAETFQTRINVFSHRRAKSQ
jgi:2-oxoglutarate ferredoxin oxidoreductase subunit alpha